MHIKQTISLAVRSNVRLYLPQTRLNLGTFVYIESRFVQEHNGEVTLECNVAIATDSFEFHCLSIGRCLVKETYRHSRSEKHVENMRRTFQYYIFIAHYFTGQYSLAGRLRLHILNAVRIFSNLS